MIINRLQKIPILLSFNQALNQQKVIWKVWRRIKYHKIFCRVKMVFRQNLIWLKDLKIFMINIKIHLQNSHLEIKSKISKYKILIIKQ
jgi:hypothetical protein